MELAFAPIGERVHQKGPFWIFLIFNICELPLTVGYLAILIIVIYFLTVKHRLYKEVN